MKKAVLFDLDGTLLDTLQDLQDSVNVTMEKYAYPTHDYATIRSFVGNGVKKLVERAMPAEEVGEKFDAVYADFKAYYEVHMEDKTAPYAGICEMLAKLKADGFALAVVSNKFDSGVKALVKRFFGEWIDVAIGESATVRAKPAPDAPFAAMKELGITADEAVYVGDSDVDIVTARAAGIEDISVCWGFKDRDFLEECGASLLVDDPEELYTQIKCM
ncbi:MAG: HAD-IA family hydrolase [Clostridia bacterium]|nr:HAD-IA family hydrolase [Clostridia bacterium]